MSPSGPSAHSFHPSVHLCTLFSHHLSTTHYLGLIQPQTLNPLNLSGPCALLFTHSHAHSQMTICWPWAYYFSFLFTFSISIHPSSSLTYLPIHQPSSSRPQ